MPIRPVFYRNLLYGAQRLVRDFILKKEFTTQELEELILNEKKAITRDLIDSAWDEAVSEDIETSLIAEMYIEIALEKLSSAGNTSDVSRLIQHFKNLDELGYLPSNTTLQ